jgi:hypothetical protein
MAVRKSRVIVKQVEVLYNAVDANEGQKDVHILSRKWGTQLLSRNGVFGLFVGMCTYSIAINN